jgi:hypothetical protein
LTTPEKDDESSSTTIREKSFFPSTTKGSTMKVSVVFEAESVSELHEAMNEYLAGSGGEVAAEGEAESTPTKPAKPAKTEKPAKPAKNETPDVEEEDPFATSEGEAEEGEAEEDELTVQKVTGMLEKVSKKCGVQAVRDLLASVKIKKVKEIGEEHLEALAKGAKKALK